MLTAVGGAMAKKRAKITTNYAAGPASHRAAKRAPRRDTLQKSSYVRTDASGAIRVGRTDVPLDSVVAAYHQGHSPEMIRAQYPSLTLEQVYGAIAYYLAHRADVDSYLRRQDALWSQWRTRTDAATAPVVQRLKADARASASRRRKPA
jgi:uncharacterized protein (DUF433 family)